MASSHGLHAALGRESGTPNLPFGRLHRKDCLRPEADVQRLRYAAPRIGVDLNELLGVFSGHLHGNDNNVWPAWVRRFEDKVSGLGMAKFL